jgi:predicted RNase H-like nuclease (RuvC/YqgF family)
MSSSDKGYDTESITDLPRNKLLKSRDAWKQRADELSQKNRKMQEQIRNLTESRDTWKAKAKHDNGSEQELESLHKENEELKKKLQVANSEIKELKKKSRICH